jgi:hypothetical protein
VISLRPSGFDRLQREVLDVQVRTRLASDHRPSGQGADISKQPLRCKISPFHDDWVSKGCHVKVGRIEVKLRPNHRGAIVFRRVFAATTETEVAFAAQVILGSLTDPAWRRRLLQTLEGALKNLRCFEGELKDKARSRSGEIQRLVVILKRMGV